MAFDYKKEQKQFYVPKNKPSIVDVPEMNFLAVRGQGDPNDENSDYRSSIELLYGVSYTIKMSKRGNHKIKDYFDFVVPPLEGFWWQDNLFGFDSSHKENFRFISLIRLPDFVNKEEFDWALEEATRKKKKDFSKVEFLTYKEGLCVQCMHIGPYDDEPKTTKKMEDFIQKEGFELNITDSRYHHEIYLSDPRKVSPEKVKTVIRQPIKKI